MLFLYTLWRYMGGREDTAPQILNSAPYGGYWSLPSPGYPAHEEAALSAQWTGGGYVDKSGVAELHGTKCASEVPEILRGRT